MSKIVARMEKMKAGNLGGIQRHNQRETDNHSNKDIDVARTHLNYDLANPEPINYREKINGIIEEQRASKRAVRKDAVLVDEWIITSDKTFFETADSRKFFEDSLAYFSDRCGSQNIAYATVHLDETTPHMHLGIVPMYNNRLSSKQMFTREALKEIQDELPTYLQQRGHAIERGIKGSEQKHLTVEEYKENQREVEKMATKVAELEIQAKQFDYEIELKKRESNEEAQTFWHDNWLETKQQFPDFSMSMPLHSGDSEKIIINEHTAKEYNLNFKDVFRLFKEKYKQLRDYIALKWQKTVARASEIENKGKSIQKKQNALEEKLEGLNEEVRVREKQSNQLSELIESKTEYIKRLTNSAQLSTAFPDYVKPTKLNKDMLLVPKDKWQEKHISANAVSDMLRIKETFSRAENHITKQAKEGISNWELTSENMALRRDISQLAKENTQFESVLVSLLDTGKLDINTLKMLNIPDRIREVLEEVTGVIEKNEEFRGPSL